jgi:hypothetical protein
MATSHHGGETPRPSPEVEKILQRLSDQIDQKGKREYSRGRIGPDDDGDIAMAVAADHKHGVVILNFGKLVSWIGLPPTEVDQLCAMLKEKSRELALTTHAR